MMNNKECRHIAFIMDGNGRWAKKRNLPRYLGHKEGCLRIMDIYEACMEKGIQFMSLYAFSTENWSRPKTEINHLFTYLNIFFKKNIKKIIEDGTKIMVSGDLEKINPKSKQIILSAIEQTKNNTNFTFNICLNYGGQDEIVRAAKLFANDVIEQKKDINSLNKDNFYNYLYTKDLPPVDLLIRTSGEERISNFLLYQIAYAEFIFVKKYWPDFTKEEFNKTLEIFYNRERRYGGLSK